MLAFLSTCLRIIRRTPPSTPWTSPPNGLPLLKQAIPPPLVWPPPPALTIWLVAGPLAPPDTKTCHHQMGQCYEDHIPILFVFFSIFFSLLTVKNIIQCRGRERINEEIMIIVFAFGLSFVLWPFPSYLLWFAPRNIHTLHCVTKKIKLINVCACSVG